MCFWFNAGPLAICMASRKRYSRQYPKLLPKHTFISLSDQGSVSPAAILCSRHKECNIRNSTHPVSSGIHTGYNTMFCITPRVGCGLDVGRDPQKSKLCPPLYFEFLLYMLATAPKLLLWGSKHLAVYYLANYLGT
jgi:hypothetical protein